MIWHICGNLLNNEGQVFERIYPWRQQRGFLGDMGVVVSANIDVSRTWVRD